eukprot:gene16043-biopygen708
MCLQPTGRRGPRKGAPHTQCVGGVGRRRSLHWAPEKQYTKAAKISRARSERAKQLPQRLAPSAHTWLCSKLSCAQNGNYSEFGERSPGQIFWSAPPPCHVASCRAVRGHLVGSGGPPPEGPYTGVRSKGWKFPSFLAASGGAPAAKAAAAPAAKAPEGPAAEVYPAKK